MLTYADTAILDPATGEVIVQPGDELDDETLYRLEILGLDIWADAVARHCLATHKDFRQPFVYWRRNGSGVEVAHFSGGPLKWQSSWLDYVPDWAGRL